MNLRKLVHPSYVSVIPIPIQRRVLLVRDTRHKRACKAVHVDARRVEADAREDNGVGYFGREGDSALSG